MKGRTGRRKEEEQRGGRGKDKEGREQTEEECRRGGWEAGSKKSYVS